jgi:hypothetical protein
MSIKKDTEKVMLEAWRQRWREATRKSKRGDLAARKGSNLTNHKMYKNLYKHQASVLMQICTECVVMADFLFHQHVPDMPTPLYNCDKARKRSSTYCYIAPKLRKKNSAATDCPHYAANTPKFSLINI